MGLARDNPMMYRVGTVWNRTHTIIPRGAVMDQNGKPVEPLAINVPEAGALAGLNRVQSYIAAKRGEIPTIKVGGRLKVPLKKWRAILDGEVAP